jgi:uncharacterized protein YcgI (DUF1989 family)
MTSSGSGARPHVIYQAKPGSALEVNRDFYGRLAPDGGGRKLVERFVIPRRSGRAWPVRAGQIFRIVAVEGPQVADLNVWSLTNPRERFWASRSRQLHQAHVSTFDRLWSCLPYLRPMLTIVADTVQFGRDADGAGCHDLLGTRCDPYVHKLLNGEELDVCCHSNLVRAVAPYHLTELDVHDVLNVFQVTGLTAEGRYFTKPRHVRSRLGRGRRRSRRHLPPAGDRDLAAGRRAARRLAVADPLRLSRPSRISHRLTPRRHRRGQEDPRCEARHHGRAAHHLLRGGVCCAMSARSPQSPASWPAARRCRRACRRH